MTMNFTDYYRNKFSVDLKRVMELRPSHDNRDEVMIQPVTVSTRNLWIRRMPPARQRAFAVSLYLTFLVDQVAYTYFQPQYERFRALALYPKWRGDCPGACCFMLDPESVLWAVGAQPGQILPSAPETINFLRESIPAMQAEVDRFVAENLPEMGGELWHRCAAEYTIATAQRELPTGADSEQ